MISEPVSGATSPIVSVLIVSFNTRQLTLNCLASLRNSTSYSTAEVVLVDNASSDGTAEAVAEQFPEVVVIASESNVGFARAVNTAANVAKGEFVLLLNPDTEVFQDTLDALLRFATSQPHHGLYGGRTLRPDGSLDPSSCWGAPSLWSLACFATGMSTAFSRSAVFDPESLGQWQRDSVREVPIITGCLLLLRRATFQALNGLDPVYFLYGEDADLSHRARVAGWRPVIVPDARITHVVGASSANPGAKMSLVMAGKSTYLRRNWSAQRARLGIALLLTGVGVRACGERLLRRPGMWTHVWRTRKDWSLGFPHAEFALVNNRPANGREVPA